MTSFEKLHRVQAHILHVLRHEKRCRFTALLLGSGMTSDGFKFHIRKLSTLKLIKKDEDGLYSLTAKGKEYANRIDEAERIEIIQPKASMLLCVTSDYNSESYYLLHRRKREPYYDFWGIPSGPLQNGISIYDSSSNELKKQTGLSLEFKYQATMRVIDKTHDNGILEDKLFSIMTASVADCPEVSTWHAGVSQWVRLEDISNLTPLFPSTYQTIDMVWTGLTFNELPLRYSEDEY